jgi:hypothetical protein
MNDAQFLDMLKARLNYDPSTGALTRKYGCTNTWAGRDATFVDRLGYRRVQLNVGKVDGKVRIKQFLAHRVAWALHYGQWPTQELHHIDNDKANNAIANLMVCERAFNTAMQTPYRKRDLPRGVSLDKKQKRRPYRAVLGRTFLGLFATVSEAEAAYRREFIARFCEEPPQAA